MLLTLSIIFFILQILDVILTNKVLNQGGVELNPFMLKCQKIFDKFWWIPKIFIASLLIFICWKIQFLVGFWLLIGCILFYIGLCIHNFKEFNKKRK